MNTITHKESMKLMRATTRKLTYIYLSFMALIMGLILAMISLSIWGVYYVLTSPAVSKMLGYE